MSCRPSLVFLAIVLQAGSSAWVFATEPLQTSVCDLSAELGAFNGKEIAVHGLVYAGVDVTNISDPRCPGKSVLLTVADRVSDHRDIRSFERGLRKYGMRAKATVIGRFQAEAPVHPFPMPAIDVHAVKEVVSKQSDPSACRLSTRSGHLPAPTSAAEPRPCHYRLAGRTELRSS